MVVLLMFGATTTAGAASDQAGASCANPSVSALNQYCENIPTATGGRTPHAGTPALGGTLPPQVTRAPGGTSTSTGSAGGGARGSSAGARARRRLLTLPAPSTHAPLKGSVATASPSSLSLTLILVLLLIALALGGLALWRLRSHRPTGSAG